MDVFIGYTAMFFPIYAVKLRSFVQKFITKESSPASWAILLDMEPSYRIVATTSMTGNISFNDDRYHSLQEEFSQRLSRAYADSRRNDDDYDDETSSSRPAKRFCSDEESNSSNDEIEYDCGTPSSDERED